MSENKVMKLVPGDIVIVNDVAWVALATSIQDGETVFFAKKNSGDSWFEYNTLIPRENECRLGNLHKDMDFPTWDDIVTHDYSLQVMYF